MHVKQKTANGKLWNIFDFRFCEVIRIKHDQKKKSDKFHR